MVFTEPAAAELFEAHREEFSSGTVVHPESAIDVRVVLGSTNDIIDHTANSEVFAGGWGQVRPYLKRDVPMVRFKFMHADNTVIVSYEGLFYVGNRWVLMPKPWRYLKTN